MEIQRHSSCEGIAALKKALDGCDYFAIDFEFSGLVEYIPEYSSLESAEEDLLRTPRYKYEEKRDQINMNIPIQVGVSVFTKVQSHNTALSVVFASQICQYEHQLNYDHLKLLQSCVKDLDVADQRSKVALVDDALHRIQSEKCTDLTPDAYSASLIKHGRHRESIDVACKLLEYWRSRIEATTQQHKELAVTPPVYTAQNFSAFLFPSPTSERFQSFGVVSDTMGEFLRKADMDFNQWIRNGLRFGTVSEWMADDHSPLVSTVEHLRALPFFSMTAPPLFTESVEPFLPLTSHEAAYLMMAIKLVQSNKDTALFGDLVNLVVMRGRGNTSAALNFIPSSFCERRRQLLQQMGLRLENKRAVRSSNDGSLELTANTNFDGTRLLSLLVEAAADKPMILHNGFLDLMFFVRALHGSVPEAYADFVQVIRCHFPKFYDTRMLLTHPHMFQHGNFSASLFDSFRVMREKSDLTTPQIVRDAKLAGAVDMESLNRAHDAGGDAFITGCLFAFAEHELQKSGRNVNRYNGVVPLHGIVQFASFHSGRQQWAAFGAPCYYVFARSTDVQLMKNILSPPYIFRTCYDGMLTCILAPNPEAGTVAVSTLLNALSQRRIPHKLLHFAATNQCRILDA